MNDSWISASLLAEYRETCETVLASMVSPDCREDAESFVVMEVGTSGGERFPGVFARLFGLNAGFVEQASGYELVRACGFPLDDAGCFLLLLGAGPWKHPKQYLMRYLQLLQGALERAGQDPRQLVAIAIIGYPAYCYEIVRPALRKSGENALIAAFEKEMLISEAETAEME